MRILGIESSCDETAAAVVEDGRKVLSNVISSQIAIHTEYGGVVPEIASRKHIENINGVIQQALIEAHEKISHSQDAADQDTMHHEDDQSSVCFDSCMWDDIDAIAVTYGPGLVGALLVGVAEAKALAYALNKPLISVNHIKGHIAANYLEHPDLEPPYLCLVVSGGHTNLVAINSYTDYEIIGKTRDDAAGEAFDKVARSVGLGYPGGPKIDKEARNGNAQAIKFPQAKVEGAKYDFSFSGIKSAVLNYQNHAEMMGETIVRADLVASFQKAVVDVLVGHTVMAMEEYGYKTVALAGGVASNSALREAMKAAVPTVICPSPIFCTDNAAMIASAGYYEYINGNRAGLDLNAVPGLKF